MIKRLIASLVLAACAAFALWWIAEQSAAAAGQTHPAEQLYSIPPRTWTDLQRLFP